MHNELTTKSSLAQQYSQECFDRFMQEGITNNVMRRFQEIIQEYYSCNKRTFAWRTIITPYHVVVSEIMLQQTQTYRVAPKFDAFIERFPSFAALANASFEEVLRYWKGLGYNRRAQNLHKIAQIITNNYQEILPNNPEILETFPGIGKATAASICAFAYNTPTVFIETNIRTIFIYFFFKNQNQIPDKQIMPLITASLDSTNPREWYYALMDYGVMLKKEIGNISQLSKHHTKQTKFIGSNRQVRGKILEILLHKKTLALSELKKLLEFENSVIEKALNQLIAEQFVHIVDNDLSLL